MKYRLFALILVLAVVLSGCQGKAPDNYIVIHNGRTLSVNTIARTVTDGDDVYSYSVQEGTTSTVMEITYPNGKHMTVYQNYGSHGNSAGSLNAEEAERYLSEWTIFDAVQEATTERYKFHLGYFLLGILIAGAGVFLILDPETAIYWRHMWWFKDAEPTDFAIGMTRFSGVISAICGIVMTILSFFT